jgi:hypothetical protein
MMFIVQSAAARNIYKLFEQKHWRNINDALYHQCFGRPLVWRGWMKTAFPICSKMAKNSGYHSCFSLAKPAITNVL